MNARIRAVVIAVVLFLTAVTGLLFTARRTPQYGGKTLSEWLVMLDPNVDRSADHKKAAEAINQMGAAALPQLGHILRARPNSISQRIRDYAERWHLIKPPNLMLQDQQFRAARAAYNLAEDVDVNIAPLVPDLRYHLTNSNYADTEMARALARAGAEGISCLTNFLATGDPRVRKRAGWALTLDGRVRNQPGVQDALIHSASSDPDGRIRASMVLHLSSFSKGGETNRLIPLGLQFLRSEDGFNRWAGASLLQNFRSVPEVKTALHAAFSDPDERVRSVVERALKEPTAEKGRR